MSVLAYQEIGRRIEELTRAVVALDPHGGAEAGAALALRAGAHARARRPRSPPRLAPPLAPHRARSPAWAPGGASYAEIVRGAGSRSSSVGSRARTPQPRSPEERFDTHDPPSENPVTPSESETYESDHAEEPRAEEPVVEVVYDKLDFVPNVYMDMPREYREETKIRAASPAFDRRHECRTPPERASPADLATDLSPPPMEDRASSPNRCLSHERSYAEILALGLRRQAKAQSVTFLPQPQVAHVELVKELVVECLEQLHSEPQTDSERVVKTRFRPDRPDRPPLRSRSRDIPRQRRASEKRPTKAHDGQIVKRKKTVKKVIEVQDFDEVPEAEVQVELHPVLISPARLAIEQIQRSGEETVLPQTLIKDHEQEEAEAEENQEHKKSKKKHKIKKLKSNEDEISKALKEIEEYEHKKKKRSKADFSEETLNKTHQDSEDSDAKTKTYLEKSDQQNKLNKTKSSKVSSEIYVDLEAKVTEPVQISEPEILDATKIKKPKKKKTMQMKNVIEDSLKFITIESSLLVEKRNEVNPQSTEVESQHENVELGSWENYAEENVIKMMEDLNVSESEEHAMSEPKTKKIKKHKHLNKNDNKSIISQNLGTLQMVKAKEDTVTDVTVSSLKIETKHDDIISTGTSSSKDNNIVDIFETIAPVVKETQQMLKPDETGLKLKYSSQEQDVSKSKKKKKHKKEEKMAERNLFETTEAIDKPVEDAVKTMKPISEDISNVIEQIEEQKRKKKSKFKKVKSNESTEAILFEKQKKPEIILTQENISFEKEITVVEKEFHEDVKSNKKKSKSKKPKLEDDDIEKALKEIERSETKKKPKDKGAKTKEIQKTNKHQQEVIKISKATTEKKNFVTTETFKPVEHIDWNALLAEEEGIPVATAEPISLLDSNFITDESSKQIATEVTILQESTRSLENTNIQTTFQTSEEELNVPKYSSKSATEIDTQQELIIYPSTSIPSNEQNNNDKFFAKHTNEKGSINIVQEITNYEPIIQNPETRTIYLITHEEKKLPPIRTVKVFSSKSNSLEEPQTLEDVTQVADEVENAVVNKQCVVNLEQKSDSINKIDEPKTDTVSPKQIIKKDAPVLTKPIKNIDKQESHNIEPEDHQEIIPGSKRTSYTRSKITTQTNNTVTSVQTVNITEHITSEISHEAIATNLTAASTIQPQIKNICELDNIEDQSLTTVVSKSDNCDTKGVVNKMTEPIVTIEEVKQSEVKAQFVPASTDVTTKTTEEQINDIYKLPENPQLVTRTVTEEDFSDILEEAIFGSVQVRNKSPKDKKVAKSPKVPYEELINEVKTYSVDLDIHKLDYEYYKLMERERQKSLPKKQSDEQGTTDSEICDTSSNLHIVSEEKVETKKSHEIQLEKEASNTFYQIKTAEILLSSNRSNSCNSIDLKENQKTEETAAKKVNIHTGNTKPIETSNSIGEQTLELINNESYSRHSKNIFQQSILPISAEESKSEAVETYSQIEVLRQETPRQSYYELNDAEKILALKSSVKIESAEIPSITDQATESQVIKTPIQVEYSNKSSTQSYHVISDAERLLATSNVDSVDTAVQHKLVEFQEVVSEDKEKYIAPKPTLKNNFVSEVPRQSYQEISDAESFMVITQQEVNLSELKITETKEPRQSVSERDDLQDEFEKPSQNYQQLADAESLLAIIITRSREASKEPSSDSEFTEVISKQAMELSQNNKNALNNAIIELPLNDDIQLEENEPQDVVYEALRFSYHELADAELRYANSRRSTIEVGIVATSEQNNESSLLELTKPFSANAESQVTLKTENRDGKKCELQDSTLIFKETKSVSIMIDKDKPVSSIAEDATNEKKIDASAKYKHLVYEPMRHSYHELKDAEHRLASISYSPKVDELPNTKENVEVETTSVEKELVVISPTIERATPLQPNDDNLSKPITEHDLLIIKTTQSSVEDVFENLQEKVLTTIENVSAEEVKDLQKIDFSFEVDDLSNTPVSVVYGGASVSTTSFVTANETFIYETTSKKDTGKEFSNNTEQVVGVSENSEDTFEIVDKNAVLQCMKSSLTSEADDTTKLNEDLKHDEKSEPRKVPKLEEMTNIPELQQKNETTSNETDLEKHWNIIDAVEEKEQTLVINALEHSFVPLVFGDIKDVEKSMKKRELAKIAEQQLPERVVEETVSEKITQITQEQETQQFSNVKPESRDTLSQENQQLLSTPLTSEALNALPNTISAELIKSEKSHIIQQTGNESISFKTDTADTHLTPGNEQITDLMLAFVGKPNTFVDLVTDKQVQAETDTVSNHSNVVQVSQHITDIKDIVDISQNVTKAANETLVNTVLIQEERGQKPDSCSIDFIQKEISNAAIQQTETLIISSGNISSVSETIDVHETLGNVGPLIEEVKIKPEPINIKTNPTSPRPEKSPIHSLHDLLPEIDSIPEFKPSYTNTVLYSNLSADAPEFTPSYMYQKVTTTENFDTVISAENKQESNQQDDDVLKITSETSETALNVISYSTILKKVSKMEPHHEVVQNIKVESEKPIEFSNSVEQANDEHAELKSKRNKKKKKKEDKKHASGHIESQFHESPISICAPISIQEPVNIWAKAAEDGKSYADVLAEGLEHNEPENVIIHQTPEKSFIESNDIRNQTVEISQKIKEQKKNTHDIIPEDTAAKKELIEETIECVESGIGSWAQIVATKRSSPDRVYKVENLIEHEQIETLVAPPVILVDESETDSHKPHAEVDTEGFITVDRSRRSRSKSRDNRSRSSSNVNQQREIFNRFEALESILKSDVVSALTQSLPDDGKLQVRKSRKSRSSKSREKEIKPKSTDVAPSTSDEDKLPLKKDKKKRSSKLKDPIDKPEQKSKVVQEKIEETLHKLEENSEEKKKNKKKKRDKKHDQHLISVSDTLSPVEVTSSEHDLNALISKTLINVPQVQKHIESPISTPESIQTPIKERLYSEAQYWKVDPSLLEDLNEVMIVEVKQSAEIKSTEAKIEENVEESRLTLKEIPPSGLANSKKKEDTFTSEEKKTIETETDTLSQEHCDKITEEQSLENKMADLQREIEEMLLPENDSSQISDESPRELTDTQTSIDYQYEELLDDMTPSYASPEPDNLVSISMRDSETRAPIAEPDKTYDEDFEVITELEESHEEGLDKHISLSMIDSLLDDTEPMSFTETHSLEHTETPISHDDEILITPREAKLNDTLVAQNIQTTSDSKSEKLKPKISQNLPINFDSTTIIVSNLKADTFWSEKHHVHDAELLFHERKDEPEIGPIELDVLKSEPAPIEVVILPKSDSHDIIEPQFDEGLSVEENLVNDYSFWPDKHLYHDAECQYFLHMANKFKPSPVTNTEVKIPDRKDEDKDPGGSSGHSSEGEEVPKEGSGSSFDSNYISMDLPGGICSWKDHSSYLSVEPIEISTEGSANDPAPALFKPREDILTTSPPEPAALPSPTQESPESSEPTPRTAKVIDIESYCTILHFIPYVWHDILTKFLISLITRLCVVRFVATPNLPFVL